MVEQLEKSFISPQPTHISLGTSCRYKLLFSIGPFPRNESLKEYLSLINIWILVGSIFPTT